MSSPQRQSLCKKELPCIDRQKKNQPPPLPPISKSSNGSSSVPPAFHGIPKKPMRPLTAYHIFFQIEREYIIQTAAGDVADESMHNNKVYLSDVPHRYRDIKLLPDWYAGPGKRQKRKHRKQHGKIGFLELSRVISARWAQLEQIDPETKGFVQRIARQELHEYYQEMKAYKEATIGMFPEEVLKMALSESRSVVTPERKAPEKRPSSNTSHSATRQKHRQQQQRHRHCQQQQQKRPRQQLPSVASLLPEVVSSSCREMNSVHHSSSQLPEAIHFADPCSIQLRNDIDGFLVRIHSATQHLLPSSFRDVENRPPSGTEELFQRKGSMKFPRRGSIPLTLKSFDSLLGHSNLVDRPKDQQCMVGYDVCTSPAAVEVDICDDEIMQLWKAHN